MDVVASSQLASGCEAAGRVGPDAGVGRGAHDQGIRRGVLESANSDADQHPNSYCNRDTEPDFYPIVNSVIHRDRIVYRHANRDPLGHTVRYANGLAHGDGNAFARANRHTDGNAVTDGDGHLHIHNYGIANTNSDGNAITNGDGHCEPNGDLHVHDHSIADADGHDDSQWHA